jgi:hypothetical protein
MAVSASFRRALDGFNQTKAKQSTENYGRGGGREGGRRGREGGREGGRRGRENLKFRFSAFSCLLMPHFSSSSSSAPSPSFRPFLARLPHL